jgi:hypothetical protein
MVTAIGALVNAVIWPVIIFVLVILFREPIGQILRGFESLTLKLGGQELGIRRVVDQATERLIKSDPDAAKAVTPEQIATAEHIAHLASRTSEPLARNQMLDLAREYERTRASMSPGDARTRRMEVCVTKMRTLGLAAYPYLPEFSRSTAPGERLAAIAILQVRPDPEYWDWLADRLKEERPFVGYQAAIALLTAVRASAPADREKLERSLRKAKESFGAGLQGTDRSTVIETATRELHDSVSADDK